MSDEGEPHASRGWSLDVVDDTRMRLLVDAGDGRLHANLAANGAIAVTATNVPTLRSVQVKGHATFAAPGARNDTARMRRYCDEFFSDVEATDGIAPDLMERMVPARVTAYDVEISAIFDQTPGPKAGSALTG